MDGINPGHVVSIRTHYGGIGPYGEVSYTTNGVSQYRASNVFHRTTDAGVWHHVTVTLTRGSQVPILTVTWNGATIISVPSLFTPSNGRIFSFGGQTGAFHAEHRVDNIAILTNQWEGAPDLGAVEFNAGIPGYAAVVDDTGDTFDGTAANGTSLREALFLANPGSTVTFAPALSGQAVVLGGVIVVDKPIAMDATGLPAPVMIDGGPGSNRVFEVPPAGSTSALCGLTFTGGNGGGPGGIGGAIASSGKLDISRCAFLGNSVSSAASGIGGSGGAIHNGGTMTLTDCTFTGNTAREGGAINNRSSLSLTRCTISGNTAGRGGAIMVGSGSLALHHCTLGGNSVSGDGGAIYALSTPMMLNHCTLSGNAAFRFGGAIYGGSRTLNQSIAAGNTALYTPNIDGTFTGSNNLTTGDPLLAPLGQYGGLTQTMPLLPGSPARDAAAGSIATSDQRGFPIVGAPDIGAYEAGTFPSFALWSLESAGGAVGFTADTEGDGAVNGLEYALRRDPLASDASLSPTLGVQAGGYLFAFRWQTAARDLRYIVQRSSDLTDAAAWTEIYRYDTSSGVITELFNVTGDENPDAQVITLTDPAAGGSLFWRLRMESEP